MSTRRASASWDVARCTAMLMVCAGLLALAPIASAEKRIVGQVGEAGAGAGQFTTARAIAVNETGHGSGANAGDIYILDGSTEQRLDQFEANGNFVRAWGWGVVNGSDEFQICTTTCQAPVFPGVPGGSGDLQFATGIAVDQASGNVIVANSALNRVDVFGSDGTFQGGFGLGVATGANAFEFCTTSCRQGLDGTDAGAFTQPSYVAVDPTTGNIYVTDSGTRRVDEFSMTLNSSSEVTGATFILAFGWGVDTGSAAFETCTTLSTCEAGLAGSGIGQFSNGQPNSVAVNSVGVVYTVESGPVGRVQSFTPSGETFTPVVFAPSLASPRHVAVGAGDHVFLSGQFPAGASTCPGGSSSGSEYRVLEFDSAGTPQDTGTPAMTCAGFSTFFGIGANKTSGDLYVPVNVSNARGALILGDTNPSGAVDTLIPTTTGAVVQATINPDLPPVYPNSVVTFYQLQYKLSSDSTWTPFGSPIDVGAGTSGIPVTINLGGLQGNTPYDVRLVVTRPFGEPAATGPSQSFTTLPVPPSIESFSSSGVTANSAELHALINPHGQDTSVRFEYGTTTSYEESTAELDAGETLSAVPVDERIDDLIPAVYHFRVVASNATGTTTSRDQTFSFYPPPCPNGTLRQLTGSQRLPDCRAYELVSPEDAGNIVLRTVGRPGPYATHPSRLVFSGALGSIGGADSTEGNIVDQYAATRTNTGWETHYVGVPGSQTISSFLGTGDLGFDRFIAFNEAGIDSPPYVYDARGVLLGRWPADFSSIPGAIESVGGWQPSPDFSHLAFSSNNVNFDPEGGGLVTAPGSAYDYDTAAETTTLISLTPSGDPIPQDPGNSATTEFIRFPGSRANGSPAAINPSISTDGTHILMSVRSASPATAPTHLYMRVNDAVTYGVSQGQDELNHAVDYIGMTADGSKAFFTTPDQLTADDHDTSTDLYMWSEASGSLTRVSVGREGAGDTDTCSAAWTAKCGVKAADGGSETDSPVAAESGDVYFYSPELLDGPANGLVGAQNLYVYRGGQVHFVAILDSSGSKPLTRIQVSSDGAHAAFVTASRLTPYDNAGYEEMYSYNPESNELICVSCQPNGDPPADDVEGSRSGIFMSDDGRAFFSTTDALVPQDTDGITDVYEYVEGRPQLITSGIGVQDRRGGARTPQTGLMGVSADGVDVYFATFDTLVAQDHNGPFLKFYDARTSGGFAPSPLQTPCEAADECHGPASLAPPLASIVSSTDLGAGRNSRQLKRHRHRRYRHGKHRRRRHRRRRHRHVGRHGRGTAYHQQGHRHG